jgi:uncharacterized protein
LGPLTRTGMPEMKPPVRTITVGIADPHPLTVASVDRARSVLSLARDLYRAGGYEVQTLRLSTRPLLQDLAASGSDELLGYTRDLQALLEDAQVDFCSLGTVRADSAPERIGLLADLLIGKDLLSASVQITTPDGVVHPGAARAAARIIRRLSAETDQSFGNFRFGALANVAAGFPFFPSAYHAGRASLTVGLQGAGIVAAALRPGLSPSQITAQVRQALIEHAGPVVKIASDAAREARVLFGGIDLSPAPAGKDSIGRALESLGSGPVGAAGTLTTAAALTAAIQGTGLPACGYNGLMLPVLEDEVLGRRWADGSLDPHKLLCYSAVCGTGLDMIPIPGGTALAQLERLLLDVATLATRLGKPLSARLMPVAGAQEGDVTSFTSPYLTNTVVRGVAPATAA